MPEASCRGSRHAPSSDLLASARNDSVEAGPQLIWPWSTGADDCCCFAVPISDAASQLRANDVCGIRIPPQLKHASEKRKAEFLAGRRCAGMALKHLGGKTDFPGISSDRSPHWPVGYTGSISHTRNMAVSLVGRSEKYPGLGVDLEKILTGNEAEKLADLIMKPQERRCIAGLDFALLTTLVFSAKESLFKALYPAVKHICAFGASEFTGWDDCGFARLRLATDLSPCWSSGHVFTIQFSVLGDHLLTMVALPARPAKPSPPYAEPARNRSFERSPNSVAPAVLSFSRCLNPTHTNRCG